MAETSKKRRASRGAVKRPRAAKRVVTAPPPVERASSYAFTVKSLDSPRLKAFKERLRLFRLKRDVLIKDHLVVLNRHRPEYDSIRVDHLYMAADADGDVDFAPGNNPVLIPNLRGPRYQSRLGISTGRGNVHAHLYRKGGELERRGAQGSVLRQHAKHFDVYIAGETSLSGYESVPGPDIKPRFDAQGRLHHERGPACRLVGFEFYFWHGVQVPRDFVRKKKSLTAARIFTIRDAELRRCAIEIVGWEPLLASMQSRVLDEDPDPEIGTLIAARVPIPGFNDSDDDDDLDDEPPRSRGRNADDDIDEDDEDLAVEDDFDPPARTTRARRGPSPRPRVSVREQMALDDEDDELEHPTPHFDANLLLLRVRCGTGRSFAIPVPNGMRTARQAQAWMLGLATRDFVKPEVRT